MDRTDVQWRGRDPLIGELPTSADRRGRPWRDSREVLHGIVGILQTGAQWADLPKRYPPYQTYHRRFHRWAGDGTLEQESKVLAANRNDRGGLDLSECCIDGMFLVAKTGADVWERATRGTGTKLMGIAGHGQTALVVLSPRVSPGPPRLRPRAGPSRPGHTRLAQCRHLAPPPHR